MNYAKLSLLESWAPRVLSLGVHAEKAALTQVISLGKELELEMSKGGGLWPKYLRAVENCSPLRGALLYLDLETVEGHVPPEERKPLSWWGIHFSEFAQKGIFPWAKTLGLNPGELYALIGEKPPQELSLPDGSWNSPLAREFLEKIIARRKL